MSTNQSLHALYTRHGLTPRLIHTFQKIILDHYHAQGRKDLSFRKKRTPYSVLVSEIMLQQTQVQRGIEKFNEFMSVFPDFDSLARAPLQKLLRVWSGLGYNRRALALQSCAREVMEHYDGALPRDEQILLTLPCIGPYTAGAIRVFAFNEPTVLIETNIRTVYIHFFFPKSKSVSDSRIKQIVERTLYKDNPRLWYDALMDYGVKLKREFPNPSRKSKHYVKQSRFKGSLREARGVALRVLTGSKGLTAQSVEQKTGITDGRISQALTQLHREGFLKMRSKKYFI